MYRSSFMTSFRSSGLSFLSNQLKKLGFLAIFRFTAHVCSSFKDVCGELSNGVSTTFGSGGVLVGSDMLGVCKMVMARSRTVCCKIYSLLNTRRCWVCWCISRVMFMSFYIKLFDSNEIWKNNSCLPISIAFADCRVHFPGISGMWNLAEDIAIHKNVETRKRHRRIEFCGNIESLLQEGSCSDSP